MQNKYQKGSAILITLMILGVVLVTALSVALVTIQEMKGSRGAAKTTATYQTADEGVEAVMYDIIKGDRKTSDKLLNCQNDGTVGSSSLGYRVILMDKDDNIIHCKDDKSPISDIKRIKSVGTLGNESQRSVDASIPVSCNGTTDDEIELLLHFDGGDDGNSFVDATDNHEIDKNGDVRISSEKRKFCKSAEFDGDNDFLHIDDRNYEYFNFSDEDFTIDFWIFIKEFSLGDDNHIFYQYDGIYRDHGLWIDSQGKIMYKYELDARNPATTLMFLESDEGEIQASQWYHIALVRDGGDMYLFKDGKKIETESFSDEEESINIKTCSDCISSFYIGDDSHRDNGCINGYLDEFRVSKGVARWKNDFTPPSYPY